MFCPLASMDVLVEFIAGIDTIALVQSTSALKLKTSLFKKLFPKL